MPRRVGLLGLGQIGAQVADAIKTGDAGETELLGALVRDLTKHTSSPCPVYADVSEFLALDTDIVVEVAGQPALYEHAEQIVSSGKYLMVLSVGAFADAQFFNKMCDLARQHGCQVFVPSGAIAGLDAIASGAIGGLETVEHIVRKPPRAFTRAQLAGPPPTSEPRLLFDGPARTGARLFPENVNVAAAVSLAGVGLDRTTLRVYADPTVSHNTHEVTAVGYFGRLTLLMENIPTNNPKTGRIVALSVVRTLRNLTAPVVVGA